MISFRELVTGLRGLGVERARPVIAHASLSAFGEIQGGADVLLGALLSVFDSLVVPTFTYKTMLIPENGPPDNAIRYGSGKSLNAMAEFFRPDLPADRLMGALAETLRTHPRAQRSSHPILSFAGVNAEAILRTQTIREPLAPIGALFDQQGWVLLMGVDQTVNTSIHYAERLAGRNGFARWALSPGGVQECPGFPGCSDGFNALEPRLEVVIRHVQIGQAMVKAIPLVDLVERTVAWISADPQALLCERYDCERCQAVRAQVSGELLVNLSQF